MVAADGDPLPAPLRDRIGRILDSAGKTFGCAARITATCDVDGRARFPEGQGDALANSATSSGDDCHSSGQRRHDTSEAQLVIMLTGPSRHVPASSRYALRRSAYYDRRRETSHRWQSSGRSIFFVWRPLDEPSLA